MRLKKLLKCIKYEGESLCIISGDDHAEYSGNVITIEFKFPKLLKRKVRGIVAHENVLYIEVD